MKRPWFRNRGRFKMSDYKAVSDHMVLEVARAGIIDGGAVGGSRRDRGFSGRAARPPPRP